MGWELATPHSLRGFYETSVPADFTSYAPMSLKAGVLSSPGLSPKKTRSKRGEARECAPFGDHRRRAGARRQRSAELIDGSTRSRLGTYDGQGRVRGRLRSGRADGTKIHGKAAPFVLVRDHEVEKKHEREAAGRLVRDGGVRVLVRAPVVVRGRRPGRKAQGLQAEDHVDARGNARSDTGEWPRQPLFPARARNSNVSDDTSRPSTPASATPFTEPDANRRRTRTLLGS